MLIDGDIPNKKAGLFRTACLNKILGEYVWTNKSGWNKIKNVEISLLVTAKKELDLDYMKKYITELERERIVELEQERITELEQRFTTTGLNDYALTAEDRRVLSLSLVPGVTKPEISRLLLGFSMK